jgi:hypothetical protein
VQGESIERDRLQENKEREEYMRKRYKSNKRKEREMSIKQ